ncbi:hypothetical protein FHS19_002552 [Paenibacillus rhizosphaerae]|uniref:SAF domain-containing protein n=1 Tax=Paenibacillus rhizosphaerae TaxID=297318 RepID=A0A839TR71_9BACL|nr:SAF domain-containing protein [Paenibacillus rhizosphaerae]MBB3127898.1 hypothetical protein [Paenibacillus rhizosphaerae]
MSKLRQRTKHLIYAGLTGASAMGLLFAGYAVWNAMEHNEREGAIKRHYQRQIADLEQAQLQSQKSMASGWTLSRDVAPGETIKQGDLIQIKLPLEAAPGNLIANKDEAAGRSAKIELGKGTPLTEAMLYEGQPTAPDLRNREMKAVSLPSNLKQGDTVDVRIQFPSGQDYIVLSKKKIDKLASPTMWIKMNEQEILSLSSAMVDAYLHDAALYALTYVEPEMQSKAVPTYPVNKAVMKLIASDPNIVNKAEQTLAEAVRTALESDLASPDAQASGNGLFSASEYSSGYGEAAGSSASTPSTFQPDGSTPAGKSEDTFTLDQPQQNKLLEQAVKESGGSTEQP